MKYNVGGMDQFIRTMSGVALFLIGYFSSGSIPVWGSLALYAVAAIVFITGLLGLCPLYLLLGINTCEPSMKQRFSSR